MVITIVGAGGKTTVGSHIGKKLAAMGRHVLLTTTTKIFMPTDETVYLGEAENARAESGFMVAAKERLPGGKLKGYTAQDIQTIADLGLFDEILVEADGAARKPVKAPNEREPVYPALASLIIGVIGIDSLGKPVSDVFVHRRELFCRVTGAQDGEPITSQHIINLISHPDGLFRNAPAAVPKVVFLNKCDTIDETAGAQGSETTPLTHASAGSSEIVRLSPYPVMLTGYKRNWFSAFYRCYMETENGEHN